jgi:hypothetical protein
VAEVLGAGVAADEVGERDRQRLGFAIGKRARQRKDRLKIAGLLSIT